MKAKKLFAMMLLSALPVMLSFGQVHKSDSININLPESEFIQQTGSKTDSIQQIATNRIDSLQSPYKNKLTKLDSAQDRLLQHNVVYRSTLKLDSIRYDFYQRSDSLKNTFSKTLGRLDSAQRFYKKKLDSLTYFQLPSNKIVQKLDSLNKLRENTVASFEKKLQSVKDKVSSKLKDLDLPPEVSEKVNSITKNIEAVKIPSSDLNIPSLNLSPSPLGSATDIGKIDGLSNVDVNNPLQAGGVTEKVKMPDQIGEVKQIANGQGKISEMANVTGQVKEYSNEAQQVTKGNFGDATNVSKLAEEKAVKASGIKELEGQTKGLDEYKAMTTQAQDPEALKKEAVEIVRHAAVNHFAGKEEQLKAAMETVSKYKQKYSSLSSLSELSKRTPNEMRGKPLCERIVPGITFQIRKKGEAVLVDFNPYVGYRFTGRIRAGLGWNQRIGYNTKQYGFSPSARVYGPRAFGEFRLGKGFSPRAELELMNTGIPPLQQIKYDPSHREWVWGAFVGMKKEYRVFNNVKGTAMIMLRLANPQHKSPYADVLNVRFGFEFPMKKKT